MSSTVSNGEKSSALSDGDYAAVVRSMIQHEGNLLNNRMTWMWTLQGFLITALSFIWNAQNAQPAQKSILLCMVCLVGLASSVSVGYSLHLSLRVSEKLIGEFKERCKKYDGPPLIGVIKPAYRWLLPWRFFPYLMGVFWVAAAAVVLTPFRPLC